MTTELSMKEFFNDTKRDKLLHSTDQPGIETVRREDIKVHRYGNYYNIQNSIVTAGPTDPQDFDKVNIGGFPVYNRERIFEHLEHNAEIIYVVNTQPLGGSQLFVIESHKSVMGFSHEVPIDPQQQKEFHNIYELRLRSPLQGLIYRVSTYPVSPIA